MKGWREKDGFVVALGTLGGLSRGTAAPAGSLLGTGGRLPRAADTSVQMGKERLVPGTGSCQTLSRGTHLNGSPMLLSDDLRSDWDPWSLGIRDLSGPDPSLIWEMVGTLKPHRAVQWCRSSPSRSHTRYQILNYPWGRALWLFP